MKHLFRRLQQNTKGQSLVEFALTASLLLLIIFGGLAFIQMYNQRSIIGEASREAARVYSIQAKQNPAQARQDAISEAISVMRANDLDMKAPYSIHVGQTTFNGQPTETCDITYTYQSSIALLHAIIHNGITMKSHAQFPQEP